MIFINFLVYLFNSKPIYSLSRNLCNLAHLIESRSTSYFSQITTSNYFIFKISSKHNIMDYVDINECEKELELLGNKEYSLYKILNFCSTLGGASLLREWISKPLKNIAEINSRLDMVEYFNKETALRMNLFAKLKKIPNLGNLFEKFAVQDQSKKGAKLHHCVKLYKYSQVYSDSRVDP